MCEKILELHDCYGCGVCAIACPSSIIELRLTSEGFYRPFIDKIDKCTGCGICEKVCSCLDKDIFQLKNRLYHAFSGYSNSSETLEACSSGGIAFEIARKIIEDNGAVAGVRYNIVLKRAEHYVAENIEFLKESIGSKYIQSYTPEGFEKILKSKKAKKMVIGTPCQIDSFRRLLSIKKKENDFILVDFFCHGVPGYNMWRKYIEFVEATIGDISSVRFRDKKHGWHNSWAMVIKSHQGNEWFSLHEKKDLFYQFFLGNTILNRDCYSCKFKCLNSAADIRVGDLWGKKYENNFNGISGVLVNTHKGLELLTSLSDCCNFEKETVDIITEGQMKKGMQIPFERSFILKLLKTDIGLPSIYKAVLMPLKGLKKVKRKLGI